MSLDRSDGTSIQPAIDPRRAWILGIPARPTLSETSPRSERRSTVGFGTIGVAASPAMLASPFFRDDCLCPEMCPRDHENE